MMQINVAESRVGGYSPVVLTQILKRTADEGRSGALHVVSGPSVKTIHFEKGSVRFAMSNVRRDRLGESMLAHEFISKRDFELASEKMKSDGCRFGEALLQLGRLTADELNRELAIQVQRIVLSLFRIPAGTYSYEDARKDGTATLPFGLPVPPLLLKGLRAVQDGRLILSFLPPADISVRVAPKPPYRLKRSKLTAAEIAVLDLAGDGAELGSIIRDCGHGKNAAFKSCFVLLSVGLLEPVPDSLSPVANETVAPSLPPEAAVAEWDENDDEERAFRRERILEQFDRLGSVSELELLGVPMKATTEDLESAYEGLKSEWHSMRGQTREPELLEKIDAIEFRLAAAYARLLIEVEKEQRRRVEVEAAEEFARRQRTEQLERDARLHVQVKDWDGAVSLLHELVALEPNRAEFQAMLGKSMQHVPTMRRNAEQHFVEAIALAPDDVAIRLELARFYLNAGNRARALGEIHAALAIDPDNEEAQRLIVSLREPTPMQKLLRRVFS